MGRLRTIKLLLCLQGCCSYYMVKLRTMTLLLFAEDNQIGYMYDEYKSRPRTTRMALVANRLICGQAECCGNYKGKLKTTTVLWWLRR